MKYKNLFFDLDDTIWAFSQNARNTFEEVYQKYSFDRYFDSFNHYYTLYQQRNTELWVEYGEGKITKDELNSQRFFYPLQAVGVKDEAIAEQFSRDFFASRPAQNFPETFFEVLLILIQFFALFLRPAKNQAQPVGGHHLPAILSVFKNADRHIHHINYLGYPHGGVQYSLHHFINPLAQQPELRIIVHIYHRIQSALRDFGKIIGDAVDSVYDLYFQQPVDYRYHDKACKYEKGHGQKQLQVPILIKRLRRFPHTKQNISIFPGYIKYSLAALLHKYTA